MKECQQRGLTFASPLRARVRLVILDKEAAKETIKEVKEQEVYMGEIPLMTNNGSFVVNGTERVIVSQLHRSPGVFFEHDRGKTHSSGKLLFSARIIPYRGSLARLRVRPEGLPVFPRRPSPQDAGDHPAEGHRHDAGRDPATFHDFEKFSLEDDGARSRWFPDRLRGEMAKFDVIDLSGKVIVTKDKRITAKHHPRAGQRAGIDTVSSAMTSCWAAVLATNVVSPDGELVARANDEITEDLLDKMRDAGVTEFSTCTSTTSTAAPTSPRPCASTRPPTSGPPAWRSTA